MAVVAYPLNVGPQTSTAGMTTWAWRATSTDASGSEEIVPAPEPGYQYYITNIRMTSNADVDVWLCDDEGTKVTPEIYFLTTGSGFYEADYSHGPLFLGDGRALHVDASGAGDISVEVEGFTAGAPAEYVETTVVNQAYVIRDKRYPWRMYDAFGEGVVKYIQEFVVLPTDDQATTIPTEWKRTLVDSLGDVLAEIGLGTTAGGSLVIVTDDSDNDGQTIQLKGEAFQMGANKPMYFGIRLKLDDATQTDFIVGFCITDGALLAGVSDAMYFEKVDASTSVSVVTELNDGETQIDNVATMADDTFITLEMYAASNTDVLFYVNGVLVAKNTGTLPTDEVLTPSIEFLTGDNSANTMTVDWLRAIQLR